MTITLKDVPLNAAQTQELAKMIHSVAELLQFAYDHGYADGYEAGCYDEREDL